MNRTIRWSGGRGWLLYLGLIVAMLGNGPARADDDGREREEKYLYIWAGHVDHSVADFLAVIDFDEDSPGYGQVINTVPLPGPGATFNEPHHMHLSADGKILGCGGLLSVLSGQPGIFFFDVTDPRRPRFLFSTADPKSSITDDFLPLPAGGFLVTQMGSANGDAPGRVVEFDGQLRRVGSWPANPPADGFNPHGISARPDLNLVITSDFLLPDSTLSIVPGPPVLRSTVRVWDLQKRQIIKTIEAPGGVGMMDVKLIPRDRLGRAYSAGMFNGLLYLIDPQAGTATQAFDFADVVPHVDTPMGGMPQILQLTDDGSRLIAGMFQAGQVVMLDTTDRSHLKQVDVVNLGAGAGPHMISLTHDGRRLVVADYFLVEDMFPLASPGKVQLEGDHRVHVLKVHRHRLKRDARFNLDFNTAFPSGPARPHGIAFKSRAQAPGQADRRRGDAPPVSGRKDGPRDADRERSRGEHAGPGTPWTRRCERPAEGPAPGPVGRDQDRRAATAVRGADGGHRAGLRPRRDLLESLREVVPAARRARRGIGRRRVLLSDAPERGAGPARRLPDLRHAAVATTEGRGARDARGSDGARPTGSVAHRASGHPDRRGRVRRADRAPDHGRIHRVRRGPAGRGLIGCSGPAPGPSASRLLRRRRRPGRPAAGRAERL
jgi:selenium-binding protein 1